MPTITKIPATRNRFAATPIQQKAKRRVAAYARVSTDSAEQLTSYAAQVSYYQNFIQSNPDWEFLEVYADEGISGVSTKNRPGFNRMIADAKAGKIDLIVTKSVSRFARNTVDMLVNVRELKEAGCECFFEEQSLWTFDSTGELMLTLLSSIAQEESRNISENVTWGHRKHFADGKVFLPYKHFLGYDRGEDGRPVINPKQAETVREIYRLYIDGMTPFGIAKLLNSRGVKTPTEKGVWSANSIRSILTNEKYKGDALLQKKYTVDFLTKKQEINRGEIPQYYVEGSHPAIINPVEWDLVQVEMERRKGIGRAYSSANPFSSKLVCGDCGDYFGLKVWHSTDRYRKEIWRCNHKFDKGEKCNTPHLVTEQIQSLFIVAYNKLMQKSEQVIADCLKMCEMLTDCTDIEASIKKAEEDIAVAEALIANCVHQNARTPQSQDEYRAKYASLEKEHNKAIERRKNLLQQKELRKARTNELRVYIDSLQNNGIFLDSWDEKLWLAVIENATVHNDGSITFTFKNGVKIHVAEE